MTNLSRLERLADETFHSVILEFDPGAPATYRKCVKTLEELERRIESSMVKSVAKRSLLVRVRTHLALMASEVSDHAEAERLTANVLEFASVDHPDFALNILIRTQTLHSLGRHEEESTEGLKYAESEGVTGHTLVYLLVELARRHPESIEWKDSLISRVKTYVSESPELAERLQHFPLSEKTQREYILAVNDANRRINFERTARILGEVPKQ
jgi:hypothetical protein